MKRLLVVDDEHRVVEGIVLIVKRELADEFEVAGTASSGRDAIEKALELTPDIVLMDVRMPGLSGLEAIREIRARGSAAVFLLVTAYERFDIAREAVGLGVLDYLLKPVSKDKLALALRSAAQFADRRNELERKEIEHRETAERLRGFVEAAFLQGLALGEGPGPDLELYRETFGFREPLAIVVAAFFLPRLGSERPAAEIRGLFDRFRDTLRYKTGAMAGPLFTGRCVVLLPVRAHEAAADVRKEFSDVVAAGFANEMALGLLRLGFSAARPVEEAAVSWAEALRSALVGEALPAEGLEPNHRPFEDDEAFLEELAAGLPERASLVLERILAGAGTESGFRAEAGRTQLYRFISLLGAACRTLARRGRLDAEDAKAMLDFEDLRQAWEIGDLVPAVRARFARLTAAMRSEPSWSPPVSGAIAFIKSAFERQVNLEQAAETVGLSPNRLSRLLVEETGRGFSDILIEYRIERAKELLLLPGASIKQVSVACGYPDPNYFSRLFKKVTGKTPTAFSAGTTEEDDE
jgi:two-component system response regulator YesN